jgi:hypothetical protein
MKRRLAIVPALAVTCIGLIIIYVHSRSSVPSEDVDLVARYIEEHYGREVAEASAEFKTRTDGLREGAGEKLLQAVKTKTPRKEVERLFGKPDKISDSPKGEQWIYTTGYSKAIFITLDSNDNVWAAGPSPEE